MIDLLAAGNAKVIGHTVLFSEPQVDAAVTVAGSEDAVAHPAVDQEPHAVALEDAGAMGGLDLAAPAALQDDAEATVVGTRSYGKGVFQEEHDLANGGALKLTVGEYFTPNGENLARTGGIHPRGHP